MPQADRHCVWGSAVRDRLVFHTKVKSIHMPEEEKEAEPESRNGVDDAWKKVLTEGGNAFLEVEALPEGEDLYLRGVNIFFTSGASEGKKLLMGSMHPCGETGEGILTISMCYGGDDLESILRGVKPGDTLCLDNSDYIAIQSYYRHQVPADLSFHAWDRFRNPDGTPALPQRANVMGYQFTGTGTVQDGCIQGKVLLVQALMDESTCPWCADWYRGKVREAKGSEEDFRVYFMQRCMHGDVSFMGNNMTVNYKGALLQALLDMAAWLQEGKEPLPSTVYRMEENQVIEEADPAARRGMQAGVLLTVNGRNVPM